MAENDGLPCCGAADRIVNPIHTQDASSWRLVGTCGTRTCNLSGEMQLATCRHVTGLMYKGISFRSMSKLGRVIAPGFVLGAIGSPGVRSDSGRAWRQANKAATAGRKVAITNSSRYILPTQPSAEKSPVDFLLFTERVIFALPSVVRWRNRRTGLHAE